MDELERLLADLLMEDPQESFEDRFLKFLVMEHFVSRMRKSGLDNKTIFKMCLELDNERQNEA